MTEEMRAGSALGLDDHRAREQIRTDLGSTVFVQAAAGSGKTSTLVDRVVALVDDGRAELREIAAITFTEAAASELRSRVAAALAEGATGAERADSRVRRQRALVEIDEAAMTTIHGFAQRMLADHPIEAGLPLRFNVNDEIAASVARQSRFSGFTEAFCREAPSADLLRAATLIGVTIEHLRSLSRQVDERFDGLDLPAEPLEGIPSVVERLGVSVRRLAEACLEHLGSCPDPDDRLLGRIFRLGRALEADGSRGRWPAVLAWLVALPSEGKARVGRAESWPDGIATVRESLLAYEDARAAAIEEISDAVLGGIGRRLLVEASAFATERRLSGELFFHDLLVLARDLLQTSPEVRQGLRERYRYILVDEFQDTDPLQFEILTFLATNDASMALEPGRLFFVGDPMQSIYRFRGADVELYRRVRTLVDPGSVVHLTTNFRSVPAICDFVASTFAHFVDPDDGASIALRPFRTEEGGPRIWALGRGDASTLAAERRSTEASDVVAAIVTLVESGALVTVDGTVRPMTYGDVAVLVPVRTGLSELLRAFDRARVDVRMTESSLVYSSEEVSEVIAVLRAINDRGDDRDTIGALRTSIFALTDGELRAHADAGGRWDLGVADPRRERLGHRAVLQAIGELRALRDGAAGRDPVDVLLSLIDQRAVREIAASTKGGAEGIGRLDFLVRRARACRDGGGRTVADLVQFFELETRVGVRLVAPVDPEEGSDAVRILTVHGAKGLEFPVVVLAELGGAIGRAPRSPSILVAQRRVEISLGGPRKTAGYPELAELDAEADRAEAIRLAYVGVTRAREYLLLSLHHRPQAAPGSSLAALFESVVTLPSAPTTLQQAQERRRRSTTALDRAGFDAYCERWRGVIERASQPIAIAPSALEIPLAGSTSEAVARPVGRPTIEIAEDGLGWRRARASTAIGRAVHAALQRVDLADPVDLVAVVARAAEAEGCAEFVDVVESAARAAVAAPIVREAVESAAFYRELPLTLLAGRGFVEGVVDLCFESEDGTVIVDYKTDVVADKAHAVERAVRYRLQAAAYALALGEITGRRVARVVLLFLAPPDGAIEVPMIDLDVAITEVRGSVEETLVAHPKILGHDRGR